MLCKIKTFRLTLYKMLVSLLITSKKIYFISNMTLIGGEGYLSLFAEEWKIMELNDSSTP